MAARGVAGTYPARAGIAALTVVLLIAAAPAVAWGPAMHAYVVARVLGPEALEAVFGATLPDFNGAARLRPTVDAAIKRLTHYEFERLAPSSFATGFATHNGVWGADHYAHHYPNDVDATYYATRKIKALSARTGLSLNLAEDVFEAAMDMRVGLECGPELGRLIRDAARSVGPKEEQAIVDAFAAPLAERVPELSAEDAESALRWAFRAHKALMQAFAVQLMQDREYMLRLGAPLLARHLECDAAAARKHLEAALELCADWREEMDRMAEKVGAALRAEA
ncbi:MAG TPA: hypothetical protein PKI11_07000 [Candidatus Hydrogenedentes bacterium]|nr:hypothetical protein [Candidatus Hydrogenedentota bacterium]HNT87384.1 hypothetical protein [Candidatus Hydrogenedentota bacterium]